MIYETKEFTVKDGLKVTLKTPERADAEQLLDFIRRAAAQTPFLLSTPEDYASFTVEKEGDFIDSNREGPNWLITVCVDGEIVGDCSLSFNRHVRDRHRASIGIGIDEAYWNKGIGSLLFDEMIRLARETEGIEQLELGVNCRNERAKRLYEKKGFVKTGAVPRAMKQPDGTYDDEEMMVRYL